MITPNLRPLAFPVSTASCFLPVLLLGLLLSAAFPVEVRAEQHDPEAKRRHEKPYALIFGTVWGPDDRPVYGVRVKVRRANEKKTRWELYSIIMASLPSGRRRKADYVVVPDLRDFKSLPGKKLRWARR